MPLYEYECFVCRHRFERIQRVADDPLRTCPECGGAVRRLLGVPALQFKGSGFYITDYAKKGSDDGPSTRDDKPAAAKTEKDGAKAAGSSDTSAAKAPSSSSKPSSSDD